MAARNILEINKIKKLSSPTSKISKCIDQKGSAIAEYTIHFKNKKITRDGKSLNDKLFLEFLKKDIIKIENNYQNVLIYVNGSAENHYYLIVDEELAMYRKNNKLEKMLMWDLNDDFISIAKDDDFACLSIYEII